MLESSFFSFSQTGKNKAEFLYVQSISSRKNDYSATGELSF